jgi:hypothetical protein
MFQTSSEQPINIVHVKMGGKNSVYGPTECTGRYYGPVSVYMLMCCK